MGVMNVTWQHGQKKKLTTKISVHYLIDVLQSLSADSVSHRESAQKIMKDNCSTFEVRIKRNGVTDAITVELGETISIPDCCNSIKITQINVEAIESLH